MHGQLPTRRAVLGGGLISLAVWLASYRPTSDPSWTQATASAPWSRRDSAGFVVHDDRIWLVGGTADDQKTGLTDCWSSLDGLTWTKELEQAPWTPTVQSMVVSFSGRLWRMGGFIHSGNTFVPAGEIWFSQDGRGWTRATAQAQWPARGGGALVAFEGRLWLLGGAQSLRSEGSRQALNDVWFSKDGITWTQALQDAPWQPRAFHNALAHDGQLWILGGGHWGNDPTFLNDVWCSSDGTTWERRTTAAEWPGRLWASSASFRGHLWTMGGLVRRDGSNDIWYSEDGRTWYPYLARKVWSQRLAHSALCHSDRLWILAGSNYDYFNDVWSLALAADWGGPGRLNKIFRFLRA
ncbi:hypothetical protein SAMN05216338_102417 [Bradyrhizobium sp. Rc2d]|nr:hypothetical protein SAMN05216338_102417 [Bradyrhizobium sp. Rc2d]